VANRVYGHITIEEQETYNIVVQYEYGKNKLNKFKVKMKKKEIRHLRRLTGTETNLTAVVALGKHE